MTTEKQNEERNWHDGALIEIQETVDGDITDNCMRKLIGYLERVAPAMKRALLDNDLIITHDMILKGYCEDLGVVFKKTVAVHYEFAFDDEIPDTWNKQKAVAKPLN